MKIKIRQRLLGPIGLIIVVGYLSSMTSCMGVAPYQRAMLNGQDMELAEPATATFESNVEAYREGASGANGGKIGGGCGCN